MNIGGEGGVFELGMCVGGAGTDFGILFKMYMKVYSWFNFLLPINHNLIISIGFTHMIISKSSSEWTLSSIWMDMLLVQFSYYQ